jgi:hypothetical protein
MILDKKMSFGNFKTAYSIDNALISLNKIVAEGKNLYSNKFENKSPEKIFQLLINPDRDISNLTDRDYELMRLYQRFSFDFGDQFNIVRRSFM